jgi:hypothetical protein
MPFRRNGHQDRDSVGKERKFESHSYFSGRQPGLLALDWPECTGTGAGYAQGRACQGRRGSRENRAALPVFVFVGCQQGFNKRLMGTFVTAWPPSIIYIGKSMSYYLDHRRNRLFFTASSRTRLLQSILSPSSAATSFSS